MWLNVLLKRWKGPAAMARRARPPAALRRPLRPSLEQLEDRSVPSAAADIGTVLVADIHPGHGAGHTAVLAGADSAEVQRDLARVRRATARYHDLDAALADGFVNTGLPFIEGQGFHYINPGWIGTLDVEKPQLLVYAPGNRLV